MEVKERKRKAKTRKGKEFKKKYEPMKGKQIKEKCNIFVSPIIRNEMPLPYVS